MQFRTVNVGTQKCTRLQKRRIFRVKRHFTFEINFGSGYEVENKKSLAEIREAFYIRWPRYDKMVSRNVIQFHRPYFAISRNMRRR